MSDALLPGALPSSGALPLSGAVPPSDAWRRSHLEVGVVGRVHGIRGELKIRLHNAESDALRHVTRLLLVAPTAPGQSSSGQGRSGQGRSGQGHFDQSGSLTLEVERIRPIPAGAIVLFKDVASREKAEELRGARVLVSRAELPPLEPGDYYLVDLIGCTVMLGGEALGRAVAVRPDPTVDTLVIELTAGGTVEQPILDPWIGRVDVERGIVELASDDGLIV